MRDYNLALWTTHFNWNFPPTETEHNQKTPDCVRSSVEDQAEKRYVAKTAAVVDTLLYLIYIKVVHL